MDAKIDWYSFSVQLSDGIPTHGWRWGDIVTSLVEQVSLPFGAWEEGKGRAPYNHCMSQPHNGIYVSWSGRFSHYHVEFTGVGCQYLRDQGAINEVLTKQEHRTTRMDVASDFRTEVLPNEFTKYRDEKRFKSTATYHTKSGDTEYIGSRTSELMGRVYRYNSPHPRSGLLRVEHETKRKTAKSCVRYLLQNGVEQLQRELGSRFGWSHSLWTREQTDLPALSIPAQTRNEAKTDIWLRSQCAVAFRKLVLSGAIGNPEEYLREVFLSDTLSH